MSRSQSTQMQTSVNQNYKLISRWMHRTLSDWQIVLKVNGADVLIYEEYVDSTSNIEHFERFIWLLSKHCPNLTHVRLLFSGEKSDCLDVGFVKSLWQLPYLKCLSLFDTPYGEIYALKSDSNKLTTLKIAGVDENVTGNDFENIFGCMLNLQSFICEFKSSKDAQIIAGLTNLPNLRSVTLYYPSESELKLLKNCNQLEILHLYIIDENLSSDDFLEIFKEKRNLNTLATCFINSKGSYLSKLGAYCPNLTYLTANQQFKNIGDFINLKYLKLDMNFETTPIDVEPHAFFDNYADRLQVLDISRFPNHSHSSEISKLKCLKAFLCATWPSNMYQCLTQLDRLQFLSLETYSENTNDTDALLDMVLNCANLKYLRLPYKKDQLDELIQNLLDYLYKRQMKPESPFVLSIFDSDVVTDIEVKLKEHPYGNLVYLDWNAQMFASELKSLITSLGDSDAQMDDNNIFKYPGKVPGDSFDQEDNWLTSQNYKLALKSCSNKFNLEYDEELIKRCRDFAISNSEYELSNMKFAFNFKYDSIDEQNKYPVEKCD